MITEKSEYERRCEQVESARETAHDLINALSDNCISLLGDILDHKNRADDAEDERDEAVNELHVARAEIDRLKKNIGEMTVEEVIT